VDEMGFVVYLKTTGETLRYYDSESTAQSQVTAHNRKAIINALKGIDRGCQNGVYASGTSLSRYLPNIMLTINVIFCKDPAINEIV
jgi:hypothetical protein